ncbi:hypothetical protein EIM50_25925 [Pseudoxanthomonas sp. SGD-10]|nr:hypothetical protein EIM50_25925 [Pseudoxanthomonas sp. SGD-10]
MDGPNLDIQREIFKFTSVDLKFLPIFCLDRIGSVKKVEEFKVSIGWIGRLSRDKISSVQNVLGHAVRFCTENTEFSIDFHIIGEGEERDKLSYLKDLHNFKVHFVGTIVDEELTSYINKNVDVVFAMGTSSLESASMKKPTVLVDFSYSKIPTTNRFQWLFQSVNFSVGDYYNKDNIRTLNFDDIIWCVHKKEHLVIGELCYSYFKRNHSLEMVKNIFLEKLTYTRLTVSDIEKTRFKNSFLFRNLKFIKRYIKSGHA